MSRANAAGTSTMNLPRQLLTTEPVSGGLTSAVQRPAQAIYVPSADATDPVIADGTRLPMDRVLPPQAIPLSPSSRVVFEALQKWEGRVLSRTDSTFVAVVSDLVDGVTEEQAEFEIDDVTKEDRPLVQPGAIFYWSIGYRVELSGERSRVSILVFRRLPAWSELDLERVATRAQELRDGLQS